MYPTQLDSGKLTFSFTMVMEILVLDQNQLDAPFDPGSVLLLQLLYKLL